MSDSAERSRVPATAVSASLRAAMTELYAEYAACLDEERFDAWPDFFTEHCRYRVVPRENYARGLPLSTMDLQSRGALMDRVYGVKSTLFHAPYYQRHIIGPARIRGSAGSAIAAEANYLVIRTKRDAPSDVFNAGCYIDLIEQTADGLRFAEKICVFDSELISNSIIYPI